VYEAATTPALPAAARGDLVPLVEERAVIARLQRGDRAAVAELYGWYGTLLFRQAILPKLPVQELAEDVLRDTFRTALEKIQMFRDENRSIFFWLRRIAVNKAIDVYRRYRRDQELSEAVQADADELLQAPARPERNLEVEDTRHEVELSLSRMNERYAQALRMRLLEERTREECAGVLGVTVGNFDVILHRAAKAFRQVYPP
jgi:RNA polymerase sigma-70 factor (ECF subfamily)